MNFVPMKFKIIEVKKQDSLRGTLRDYIIDYGGLVCVQKSCILGCVFYRDQENVSVLFRLRVHFSYLFVPAL